MANNILTSQTVDQPANQAESSNGNNPIIRGLRGLEEDFDVSMLSDEEVFEVVMIK